MIDDKNLKQSAEVLRALAHPVRMMILQFIDRNGTTNVNNIYNTLKMEQSITSQHLKVLRNTNLVNTERDGKYIFYTVNYDKITNHVSAIDSFFNENGDTNS